ncbi:ABC transporter permease subunit [Methanocella arvoryzae]|uniref:ABC-type transport system, permease component n=1 Tax=Methanocella arvoryzae (strain DSM 22066 / NBRC 105507 / MRE50) TaxID=351160 RepID=Q0W618_METAR|nr:ABC transporter permease subunit [Methanocella arvoryzae]CAJ36175.1 hypothetical protein RCIX806 [Methanocella arvoryzae MRE50]
MRVMLMIAMQEFTHTLTHPLALLVGGIVLAVAYINGAGGVDTLEIVNAQADLDAVMVGFGQSWQATSMICTIMAAFLGATTIPYEKWKHTLNVLFTKPLYRKDYIAGKFVGLTAFMLVFNTFAVMFTGLLIIVYFREPLSVSDFLLRVIAYIIVMTMSCSLVIALNMLIGVLSKNILVVTSAAMTYIYFDWIWNNDRMLGNLAFLTPMNLYNKLINPITTLYPTLYDTLTPFTLWFSSAVPYIGLMLIEILVFLLAGIHLFTREDKI